MGRQTVAGTVNYHVHTETQQAFRIDDGGVVGKLVSPKLVPTCVRVADIRGDESSVCFARDGVAFRTRPTAVLSFSEASLWQPAYAQEITELLREELAAKEVIVFDHTLRVDDPDAVRGPARNVHSDYSPDGAQRRLRDLVGSRLASEWSEGHFAFINIWRPVGAAINSAPLAFVRPSSVAQSDWIPIDLIYPDRKGRIMGLAGNDKHQWIYMSKMTPDEVVFFNIYDNRGLPSLGHSAVDLVEDEHVTTIRKSIESRTLVRF